MTRIALLVVIAMTGVASAENAPLAKAPPGWTTDAEQAASLAAKANAVSHFGVGRSFATADVFVSPSKKALLFVTGVAGKVAAADRDAAARVAIDELHDATSRAALAAGGIVVDSWETKVATDVKEVRGTLQWRDTKALTQTNARIVIVADDENMVAVTAECFTGNDVAPNEKADCLAALDSLQPGIPVDKRMAVALAAEGAQPTQSGTPPAASRDRLPATMDDGSRTPLPPMNVQPQTATTDRRPVYVGFGIVVLAAVFWWNQRRRARFEKEEDSEDSR